MEEYFNCSVECLARFCDSIVQFNMGGLSYSHHCSPVSWSSPVYSNRVEHVSFLSINGVLREQEIMEPFYYGRTP